MLYQKLVIHDKSNFTTNGTKDIKKPEYIPKRQKNKIVNKPIEGRRKRKKIDRFFFYFFAEKSLCGLRAFVVKKIK